MAEIVPTILTSDFIEFTQKINSIRGFIPRVQIDFIDGKFIENETVSFETMESLFTEGEEGLKFKIDVHLMVKEPIDWINRSLLVLPDRIIGQVEFMENPLNFINEVINSGVEVGIALDLDTPVNSISDDIYHLVDIILIMGVKAGLGGQVFERSIVSKIEEIRKIVGENVEIGIDGGLDEESIELCKKAGVNIFYVGNSFWSAYDKSSSDKPAEDLEKRYNDLEQLIK